MPNDLSGSVERVTAEAPGIIPENRVLAGCMGYAGPTPLEDLVVGVTHIRGMVCGLDPLGV